MADTVTNQVRSRIMSRVRNKDTKAEVALRKALHAMGFRYRLNRRGLPGTPDLVFPPARCNPVRAWVLLAPALGLPPSDDTFQQC